MAVGMRHARVFNGADQQVRHHREQLFLGVVVVQQRALPIHSFIQLLGQLQ